MLCGRFRGTKARKVNPAHMGKMIWAVIPVLAIVMKIPLGKMISRWQAFGALNGSQVCNCCFFPAQRGLEHRARNSYGNLGRLGVTELNLCSSSHLDVGLRYSEDSLNDLLIRYCQLTRIATICIHFQNPIFQKEKKSPKYSPGGSLLLSMSIATTLMMSTQIGQSSTSFSDLTNAIADRHCVSSRRRSG